MNTNFESNPSEMSGSDMVYDSKISTESVKIMAQSVGISCLTDNAATELADDVSYRLKVILRNAAKFMHHGIRNKMSPGDVDRSLSNLNIEPQYGFYLPDDVPFHFSSGGGRDLNFGEEKELDLGELLSSPLPKLPLDVTLRTHWLCVEGVQPTVPENPPPLSREAQKFESVDPIRKLLRPGEKRLVGQPLSSKAARLQANESVAVKQLATHELSVEQQLYYKEITEACVGSDEAKRAEALQSLAVDPGLHEMLPRMCTFISEGVKVNVVQNNLAFLIYLMRMVKALLDNSALYLEKYLHELLPSISTCIVSRQLCTRPEGNHWALRDFASRLIAQICKTFNTSTNNLQTRVTRLFSRALVGEEDSWASLPALYGAVQGLSELGPEVIKVLIIPNIKNIGERIKCHLDGGISVSQNTAKVAAGNIQNQLLKVLPPTIKLIRQPPDILEEYIEDYGFMGPSLLTAVTNARTLPTTPISTAAPTVVIQSSGIPSIPTSFASTTIRTENTFEAGQIPESNSAAIEGDALNDHEIDIGVRTFSVPGSSSMSNLPQIKSEAYMLQHSAQNEDFIENSPQKEHSSSLQQVSSSAMPSTSTVVTGGNPEMSMMPHHHQGFLESGEYNEMPNLI